MDMDVLVNLLKEWPTLVLAGSAYVVLFLSPWWRDKYSSARLRLNFEFRVGSACSHQTKMTIPETEISFWVYYFIFEVRNKGKSQAEDCEAVLERVWEVDGAGKKRERESFLPVNLRWSPGGSKNRVLKTVYPGGRRFCNIGFIKPLEHQDDSVYRKISEEQKEMNKFFFDLPPGQKFYRQWDCLVPGEYEIQISVYSKNARKKTKKFKIRWSGDWKDTEEEMFREIVIS